MIKKINFLVYACFCFLLILFKIDAVRTEQDLKEQLQAERQEYEKQIKELEKEIRLIKTDIDIMYKGWIEKGDCKN